MTESALHSREELAHSWQVTGCSSEKGFRSKLRVWHSLLLANSDMEGNQTVLLHSGATVLDVYIQSTTHSALELPALTSLASTDKIFLLSLLPDWEGFALGLSTFTDALLCLTILPNHVYTNMCFSLHQAITLLHKQIL